VVRCDAQHSNFSHITHRVWDTSDDTSSETILHPPHTCVGWRRGVWGRALFCKWSLLWVFSHPSWYEMGPFQCTTLYLSSQCRTCRVGIVPLLKTSRDLWVIHDCQACAHLLQSRSQHLPWGCGLHVQSITNHVLCDNLYCTNVENKTELWWYCPYTALHFQSLSDPTCRYCNLLAYLCRTVARSLG